MSNDIERGRFEAWYDPDGKYPRSIERSGDSYTYIQASSSWEVWQARAALDATTTDLTPYEVLKDQFDELLAENRRLVALAAPSTTTSVSPTQEPTSFEAKPKSDTLWFKVGREDFEYYKKRKDYVTRELYALPPAAPALSDEEILLALAPIADDVILFSEPNNIVSQGRALLAKARP